MNSITPLPVAGTYYPEDVFKLKQQIAGLIDEASPRNIRPKALIIPHAPYSKAGYIIADAFSLLIPYKHIIEKVILVGSSHHHSFNGFMLPDIPSFISPLGNIPTNQTLYRLASTFSEVNHLSPYAQEPALETSLPFLQYCLDRFSLLPLLAGYISTLSCANIIHHLWGSEDTLIIINTNLSALHSSEEADARDAATIRAIEQLSTHLTSGQACGYSAINGLLKVAQQKGLEITTLSHGNSGDIESNFHHVTGYAAFALQ